MSFQSIQNSFVAGELSSAIYGRTDMAKFPLGATTYRNFFVGYRGGAYSRAGLAYVGMCKQPTSAAPPRDIPFQFNNEQGFVLELGDNYMRVKSNGAYVIETPKTVVSITNANPGVIDIASHGFSNGDWVFGSINGMMAINGLTWIVRNVTTNAFTLTDLYGNVVNTINYGTFVSGTFARIYTLATPYAAIDLPYLKFTQSADTMTLDCVNPNTQTGLPAVEYPSYKLVRTGAASYSLTEITYASPISAPTGVSGSVESSATPDTYYSYVVTAIDDNGNESVASSSVSLKNNNISVNAGSNTVTWTPVTGAVYYNIYGSTPSYNAPVPIGVNYGYVGEAFGIGFVDTNITADFTRTPPTHQDPFARGQITGVTILTGGSGQTQANVGYTITTATGSGFAGSPIILSGALVGFLTDNNGKNYLPGDVITITDSDGGAVVGTASLVIGPQSGTYPAVPSYLFQRAVQANTLNAPDDYFMSQPGKYYNMDSSIPITDGDAIIGNPWAQQINGIQFIQPMLSAAVIFTGGGTWLLSGGGGVGTPFTPTSQQATPQEYNGSSSTVPPIPVNSEILYVQSLGSVVRDLSYNFFSQRCTSTDVTVLSSHLFDGFQLTQWAYAQNPYYLVWGVRNDGTALSFTFIKEQEVQAWARSDTNGLFVGVCSVTEPPVNAVYWIVKRFVNGGWYYYSERFNNRLWKTIEDNFCVDAGLSYPQPTPNATLTPSGTTGTITLIASTSVFSSDAVGQVVRIGGGIMDVATYVSGSIITAVVRDNQPITATVPNDPNNTPIPQTSGNWTMTPPIVRVTGLNHLIGLSVAILADGGVVNNQTVVAFSDGTVGVTLPHSASSITIGLPFLPQLQTMLLDPPSQSTVQTKRKSINAVSIRVENTRGISCGTNQPNQATTPGGGNPVWTGMTEVKMRNSTIFAGQPIPLETGDFYLPVQGGWDTKGEVAIQQSYPIGANISALVTYWNLGDSSG